MFREDVKVTMATSGLYDWLSKVLKVSGTIGGEDGEEGAHLYEDPGKGASSRNDKADKNDKKTQLLGRASPASNYPPTDS